MKNVEKELAEAYNKIKEVSLSNIKRIDNLQAIYISG